jgi:hypothetical protein
MIGFDKNLYATQDTEDLLLYENGELVFNISNIRNYSETNFEDDEDEYTQAG